MREENRESTLREDLLRSSIHSIIDNGLSSVGNGPVIDFDSNPALNNTSFGATRCLPRFGFNRTTLLRRASTRAAALGNGFNKWVGFTKDDVPQLDGTRSIDTLARRECLKDPLSRRKRYVMVFEAISVILGLFLFIIGLMAQNSETVTLLKSANSTYNNQHDLVFKVGNASFDMFT